MIKIGILASTRATDSQAIIDSINAKKLDAKISIILSNKIDSYALERARIHGITAVFIDSAGKSREAFDVEVAAQLDKYEVNLILLIGYLRILSPWFVSKYMNRTMNVHPSLLPAFSGGMDRGVHKEVIEYGCKVSGCTLHFVDESVDGGPIILQKAVKINENETIDSLRDKVQKAEQEIVLKGIDLFSRGMLDIKGRRVIIK